MLGLAVLLEGAARKWFLPVSFHAAAYFLKDLIALLILIAAYRQQRIFRLESYSRAGVIAAVLLIPLVVGLFVIPAGALLTFKNAVLWAAAAPCIAVMALQLPSSTISRWVCVAAVLECLVGVLQFTSSSDAWVNRYAWAALETQDFAAEFGYEMGVRASGTFSYISGFATFAVVVSAWSTYRLTCLLSVAEFRYCLISLAAAMGCALASGSRGSVYVCLFCVAMLCLHVPTAVLRARLAIGLAAAFALFLVVGGRSVVTSFLFRANSAEDSVVSRAFGNLSVFVSDIIENPIGAGLGTQSQLQSLRASRQNKVSTMAVIEDNRARAAREAGLFAVAGILLTLAPIVNFCRRRLRMGRRHRGAVLCLGVPMLWTMANVLWFDHNATALWFLLWGLWLGTDTVRRPAAPRIVWVPMQPVEAAGAGR